VTSREIVERRIRESIAVKQALAEDGDLLRTLLAVADRLVEALRAGRRVFWFGNGGSAADAQHLAAELVGKYRLERRALPAVALTVNTSSLTSIANDSSFDQVFSRQLEALGQAGDVAVAISTSGRSANIVAGVEAAKRLGMLTVGLTGGDGGRLKALVDYCLAVPADETPRIQEVHLLIGHILCELVESALFGG
jgi:D-sedoheptulose 7-phosphate isomerase